jgi:hypothetical protein
VSEAKVKISGRKPWEAGGFWQDERVEAMKALHKDGLSARLIAQQLEAKFKAPVTRNMVIAKLHRLGIKSDPEKARINFMRNNLKRAPKATKAAAPKVPKAECPAPAPKPRFAIAGNGAVYEKAPPARVKVGGGRIYPQMPDAPLPANVTRAWDPLPGSAPVRLTDRKAFTCRWPIDLSGEEIAHMCGQVAPDDRYCSAHAERSRAASQPRVGAKDLERAARRWAA